MADLRHYRYFIEIAQRGSFTAASAALHITQSALSEQIQMLERQLGCKLFDRGRHGARLTPQGEALFDQALHLLSVAHELEQSARSLKQRRRTQPLRIGVTMGPLLSWLPEALAGMARNDRRLDVRIEDISTAEIFLKVSIGQLDLGIASLGDGAGGAWSNTDVEIHRLFEDDWVILAPVQHHFAEAVSVPLAALRDEQLILFPPHSSLRTVIDDFFARAGMSVTPTIETGWLEMAIRFVEEGLGVAVVPRAVTLLPYRDVRVVEIDETHIPHRVLTALHRADTPRRRTIERLLTLARDRLPQAGSWPPLAHSGLTPLHQRQGEAEPAGSPTSKPERDNGRLREKRPTDLAPLPADA